MFIYKILFYWKIRPTRVGFVDGTYVT